MVDGGFGSGFDIQEDIEYGNTIPSIKEIALLHIKKISDLCCQEFKSGYWEKKPIKVGEAVTVTNVWHVDSRLVFCNAVDFLAWIVYPYSDEDFKRLIDGEVESADVEETLKSKKKIFKNMNIMFERVNFFDSQVGRTER